MRIFYDDSSIKQEMMGRRPPPHGKSEILAHLFFFFRDLSREKIFNWHYKGIFTKILKFNENFFKFYQKKLLYNLSWRLYTKDVLRDFYERAQASLPLFCHL